MLRVTDTTDGRAACNSAIQRDSFAKNLESAWQPVISVLLGGRMLILHHAVLGVQCPTGQILTHHHALYQLMMMILSITTIEWEHLNISVKCKSNAEEFSKNKSKIQQHVTLLSGGGSDDHWSPEVGWHWSIIFRLYQASYRMSLSRLQRRNDKKHDI